VQSPLQQGKLVRLRPAFTWFPLYTRAGCPRVDCGSEERRREGGSAPRAAGTRSTLDFCLNARYVEALAWPADYWPSVAAPPDGRAWAESLADFRADRDRLQQLACDPAVDLCATVPTGKGPQTYLRALLLAADHTGYHVGQLIDLRRALGIWK